MMRLRVSHLAERDLGEIWLHIAQDRPGAADRLLERFQARFESILRAPEMGELRPDLSEGVRQALVGNYVILYRSLKDCVEIVRVLHGARDVPAAFRSKL